MGKTIGEILAKASKKHGGFAIPQVQGQLLSMQLPKGVTEKEFLQKGFSCFAEARALLDVDGNQGARIFEVDEVVGTHALVVSPNASDTDLAQNNTLGRRWSVGDVKRLGVDVTEEILKEKWENLL